MTISHDLAEMYLVCKKMSISDAAEICNRKDGAGKCTGHHLKVMACIPHKGTTPSLHFSNFAQRIRACVVSDFFPPNRLRSSGIYGFLCRVYQSLLFRFGTLVYENGGRQGSSFRPHSFELYHSFFLFNRNDSS